MCIRDRATIEPMITSFVFTPFYSFNEQFHGGFNSIIVAVVPRVLIGVDVYKRQRLNSHMDQLKDIITKSNQPDGKKLDFLVQEMNREANTIGSKANDITITNLMLEIKNEIEKIREQVQNIE